MKINNCVAGDFAVITRPFKSFLAGTVVKINFSAREMTEREGKKFWDVEARGGQFFYAADEDLRALTPAYSLAPGFRDELFDPVWIYGDHDDGQCKLDQVGLPKRSAR
jgi:hypothetical protein